MADAVFLAFVFITLVLAPGLGDLYLQVRRMNRWRVAPEELTDDCVLCDASVAMDAGGHYACSACGLDTQAVTPERRGWLELAQELRSAARSAAIAQHYSGILEPTEQGIFAGGTRPEHARQHALESHAEVLSALDSAARQLPLIVRVTAGGTRDVYVHPRTERVSDLAAAVAEARAVVAGLVHGELQV